MCTSCEHSLGLTLTCMRGAEALSGAGLATARTHLQPSVEDLEGIKNLDAKIREWRERKNIWMVQGEPLRSGAAAVGVGKLAMLTTVVFSWGAHPATVSEIGRIKVMYGVPRRYRLLHDAPAARYTHMCAACCSASHNTMAGAMLYADARCREQHGLPAGSSLRILCEPQAHPASCGTGQQNVKRSTTWLTGWTSSGPEGAATTLACHWCGTPALLPQCECAPYGAFLRSMSAQNGF